jgi:cytochrome c2
LFEQQISYGKILRRRLAAATLVVFAFAPATLFAAPARPAEVEICAACHGLTSDAPQTIGPNLWGVVGREAGTAEYLYSPAMESYGEVWTTDALQQFIATPQDLVPGTKMAYPGQPDPAAAKAIVDYLASLNESAMSADVLSPSNSNEIQELPTTASGRDALIQQYCISCHNNQLKTADLVLEERTTAEPGTDADTWEKVARRVGAGEMPPPLAPLHPEFRAARAFAESLISELDAAAAEKPYAGPSLVRRLNRTEYANAVRDLLLVDYPFAAELPVDSTSSGFDNIGDALSFAPVLLESYLNVGRKVSDLAVGVADPSPIAEQFFATGPQSQWLGEGAPLGTRGGIVVRHYFPREGDYEFRVFLNEPDLTPIEGIRMFRTTVRVQPGLHTFVATFPNRHAKSEGPLPALGGVGGRGLGGPLDVMGSAWRPSILFLLDGEKLTEFEVGGYSAAEASFVIAGGGPPWAERAEIEGPYDAGPIVATASRQKIFVCYPKLRSDEDACAARILENLTRRAFRRDVVAEDVEPFLATFRQMRTESGFDEAIAAAIRNVLVAPDFLFRLEFDPPDSRPGEIHLVDDFDLASRLSFFLWSSIPDDELLAAARHGKLRIDNGLETQVRRMLADPRADALVDNFAAQWLGLRQIANAQPDRTAYPQFDEALRHGFEQETLLFIRSIMRENRSVLEVISGDYTYLNERLADNYGIPGVTGPVMRRVELPDDAIRSGVLGHGGIMMVTSHADKTTPILRGIWVLRSLLNAPPPPSLIVGEANSKVSEGKSSSATNTLAESLA